MKAMTAEAVKRLALAHGGTVQLDGRQVNAARLQVAGKPNPKPEAAYMPPEPKPAPLQTIEAKPDPAIREAVLSIEQYAASQFLMTESNTALMESIKEMLKASAAQAPDKRPTQWVFKVKRDERTGLMESITATAK